MNQSLLKNLYVGLAVLLGTGAFAAADRPAWAPDDNDTLLRAGIAVHSFGVSPDAGNGDGYAVLRLYDVSEKGYTSDRPTKDFNNTTTYTHDDWSIDKIGNIYGIAIDKDRNIYTTASANWSPGYVGAGSSGNDNVQVTYGSLENGGDTNDSAGRVYRIDAKTGKPTVFTVLPQTKVDITNGICQGNGNSILRTDVGAGLGNIVYDKQHNQFFVSNFNDGIIYRIGIDGRKLGEFDTNLGGINADGKKVKSAYGLAVSLDGSMLYYGTIETNYHPQLFAVKLDSDGKFIGDPIDQKAKLNEDDGLVYSQNIGGKDITDDGIWAAYSDLSFTPDGDILVGIRVGCNGNFATSYDHGGVVYLLTKNDQGLYNKPSEKTPGQGDTINPDIPNDSTDAINRTGFNEDDETYKYDPGAIPLHPHNLGQLEQEELDYGPDDGYGGVAIWQTRDGQYDILATSADISSNNGVHGFMQFEGNFTITDKLILDKAIGYKAVKSSESESSNDTSHDYKGIGGDVEVLSVVPMCIGSYVWEDKGELGTQDDEDIGLKGITVKLFDDQNNELNSTVTTDGGVYEFCNLPEGRYRVCVATPEGGEDYIFGPTPKQTTDDNNDSELDSNIAFVKEDGFNCSGIYDLWANTEPVEEKGAPGDDQDDNADKLGNMTVDFGFVKKVFDLALIKKVAGDKTKYKPGENVNFTITVINQGDIDAKDVLINDIVPEGLEFVDQAQWEQDRNISEIRAHDEVNITVAFKIKENFEGKGIVNVAEIESADNDYDLNDTDSVPGDKQCNNNNHELDNDNNLTDTDGCDDLDPAPITIEQRFDLALVKSVKDPKPSYKPGEEVTFIIGVGNQGTLTGKNIQIRDIIPEGLELADSNWEQDDNEAVLKTPIASLAPKAYVTREITFKIKEAFNGDKIVNIAEIKSAENDLNLTDDDSKPDHRDECTNDKDNNPDYADSGCDDEDPAVITVSKTDLSASPDAVDSECDCAGVESNKVDATSLMGVVLMLLVSLLMGVLAMRPRTSL